VEALLLALHIPHQIQHQMGFDFLNCIFECLDGISIHLSSLHRSLFHLLYVPFFFFNVHFRFVRSSLLIHEPSCPLACFPVNIHGLFWSSEKASLENQSVLLDPSFIHNCLPQDTSRRICREFPWSGNTEGHKISHHLLPQRKTLLKILQPEFISQILYVALIICLVGVLFSLFNTNIAS